MTITPSSLVGEGVIYFMGEALMFRAGGGQSGSNEDDLSNYEFIHEIHTSNTTFVVPAGLRKNEVYVRLFGGGGGGHWGEDVWGNSMYAGGGGGYMNANIVSLAQGTTVPITIGDGGAVGGNGGTTSFGTYLAANGGVGAYISTWTSTDRRAGYGGSGGAGYNINGGNGYQFGGGGATGYSYGNKYKAGYGGNYFGSEWGGGNGGNWTSSYSDKNGFVNSESGVNTIASIQGEDVFNSDALGYGLAFQNISYSMYYWTSGGGGYGANGGYICGGGGGYGKLGTGGNGFGGGGGAYGPGGWGGAINWPGGYNFISSVNGVNGGGGGAASESNVGTGGKGICLIWYYKKT